MPYEIKYNAETETIMCRTFGPLKSEDLSIYASELSTCLWENNGKLILNDLREADLKLSEADIDGIPVLAEAVGYKDDVKRAVVFRQDAEFYQLFKNVSQRQGQQVAVFVNYDEALVWLMG